MKKWGKPRTSFSKISYLCSVQMKLNTYQKTAVTTVGAVIFLIFVGGLVRATGAGLGCPDWPKCFGLWIPPTSAAELPAGYNPAEFNVFKTWTEYLNRLVGVIIGLLIIATAVLSWQYRKKKPSVFWSSLLAFILVLFNGWLGGRVVETELDVNLITIHMILAIVLWLRYFLQLLNLPQTACQFLFPERQNATSWEWEFCYLYLQ